MNLAQLQDVLEKASRKILKDWRLKSGKDDAYILRDKLIECGWKFRRTGRGGWYHPKAPEFPEPSSLADLARTVATQLVKDSLAKKT